MSDVDHGIELLPPNEPFTEQSGEDTRLRSKASDWPKTDGIESLTLGADFANSEGNRIEVKDERTGLFTQGHLPTHDGSSNLPVLRSCA